MAPREVPKFANQSDTIPLTCSRGGEGGVTLVVVVVV